MKFFGKELKFNNNKVYHAGDKPTPSEIGAFPVTGGTINGNVYAKGDAVIDGDLTAYYGTTNLDSLYVHNVANFEDDVCIKDGQSMYIGQDEVYHPGNKPTASEIGAAASNHTHNYATINDSTTATGTAWSSSKTLQEINTSYNTMTKRVEGLEEECYETFLNRNNGMMYGRLKFDSNATSSDLSAPTQLAHGLLGSYGNLKLLANTDYTDGNNSEYVQIAAARGLSPTTSQGITVYGSYATCFGKTISTEGHGHSYLSTKGTNTISSTSADTTANWGAHGHSVHWYTATGQLNNQPSQWGYLLNLGNGSEVHQLWMTQASGDLYHRGGNASGWSGSWRTILDTSNFAGRTKINLNGKAFTINGSAPSGPATGDVWVQI